MPVWNALINYLILVKSLFFLFLVFSSYADCRVLTAKLFLTTFENSSACNTFALRPETSTPSNQNTRTFPSGSSPFCFQAHLFSLLPPQFSATFKIIHGVVSGLGGPEKVWAWRGVGKINIRDEPSLSSHASHYSLTIFSFSLISSLHFKIQNTFEPWWEPEINFWLRSWVLFVLQSVSFRKLLETNRKMTGLELKNTKTSEDREIFKTWNTGGGIAWGPLNDCVLCNLLNHKCFAKVNKERGKENKMEKRKVATEGICRSWEKRKRQQKQHTWAGIICIF